MRLRPTPRTDQNEEGIRHFDLYGFESSLAPATYEWPTFARQLERELAEAKEQRDRLAKALEACREDSCELLSERSWWADEPRCGYSGRYNETAENIKRADDALAALKGGADE